MKEITIRDFCGDYALDLPLYNESTVTLYFNSRQNALNVKRIIEVDESVPNAATVCDMQEVVRCKDCRNFGEAVGMSKNGVWARCFLHKRTMCEKDFCSYGERKGDA